MVQNLPVKRLTHDNLTIEGYSRAAVQTYWRIPELKLGFDLGGQPWDFMGTPTWIVSHTHLDHIAALPVYISRRRMMKMDPPRIYLPEDAIGPAQQILRQFGRLDRSRMPCELIGIRAGDELVLSRELVVTVGAATHTVPAFCFVVWQRRRKLKAEFQNLSGDKIRDLRLNGTEVAEEHRYPLVGYLGDSSPEGLDRNPDLLRAKILITELTFLAPGHRKEKIHKHGHMHLDDLVERVDQFQNEKIIAAHFSTRYHPRQIEQWVDERLPDRIGGRLELWL
jgi:ribonuclease Z